LCRLVEVVLRLLAGRRGRTAEVLLQQAAEIE
jgi:hypothetical protein